MKRMAAVFVVLVTGSFACQAACVNPWVSSDAKIYSDSPMPNVFSMDAFHACPVFKDLPPKEFCRKLYDVYYDGRRKSWGDFMKGLTLWAHTAQEPHFNPSVIELDPILLLNVFGTGYCGIQSGLLEGIYQSRPGGAPGKPAIEARRWFLAGIVHSVCDAYYDGKWHYYDIDIGGYAGDNEKDVWSVADVIADPKSYYGAKTTLRAKYFFGADGKGSWVDKIDKTKSYCFQDNLMLGHEMAFVLRKGESFTRYFSKEDAGWSEDLPFTKPAKDATKGYCEIVYEPGAAPEPLCTQDKALIFAIRCPYNITSSKVETGGKASVSLDLGKTWTPLAEDGLVKEAVNRWDYLLKIEGGELKKVVTRGQVHPGALPRVGAAATQMTVTKAADCQVLTYVPDWSSAEKLQASAKVENLKYAAPGGRPHFGGGALNGKGSVVIPVSAPPGCKIVKLSACVLGGTSTRPSPDQNLELHLGPAGKSTLVNRTTDCSPWGTAPETKVDHWQNNVNGSAVLESCAEAEVKVIVNSGICLGARIYVGYLPEQRPASDGTLTVTHGFDGQKVSKEIPVADLEKGPVSYPVPNGAKANQFVKMEVK